MRPYDVTNTKQFLRMESDNISIPDGAALLHNGGHVSIHFGPGRFLAIPRDQFNKLVDWYMADQVDKSAALSGDPR